MEKFTECKDCKTWEEEMYWSHFSSLHFLLTLPPDFHDHLVLPEKFASHMKVHLPDKVSLKAPSGALWKVDVLKSDDILFIGDEWKDFVKANNVTENNLLMFKYNRLSTFEVLIFDRESSCERESSYFLKKCGHLKSDHDDQNTEAAREASSTEIVEDVNEDFVFVESNKCKKDDGQEGCSGLKANTPSPLKNVLHAIAKCRDRPRKLIQPHKSPIKAKVKNRKRPIRNETARKRRQISQGGWIITEGESVPKKGQSKNQPAGDDTADGPSPISKRKLINKENEDNFQTIDYLNQTEKSPNMNDNSKELIQNIVNELIVHESGEHSPVRDSSHRVNDQIDKDPNASGAIKVVTPISWRAPEDRESSPEGHSSQKSVSRSGRQNKKRLHDSMKKLVFKNVSGQKMCSGEKISNRRPVTEEEKAGALQRASQKVTENSFTAIMRPTSVYRRFFLNIPNKWPHKQFLHRKQDVVLRVGEKTWLTTFTAYGSGEGLYNGWKRFSLDNNLEEYDVLVFTPVSMLVGEAIIMDVEIFRVVESSDIPFIVF